ncbi:MAG: BatA domain-containing protein [Planctomycetaceae bacterium]|nr:BatA domain-containing protein [Planctomycetaceae bacterium]
MTFLQPILLFGLPLVALPILIHLINRWRHRTVQWGAMMFLLDAKRLTRGMAKLRFWLIMAMRMLAIAALLFAFARPLTSGWLGLAIGGQVETTIVLLDRSASMEQLNSTSRVSKREAALTQLTSVIESTGSGSRLVLIDSVDNVARELDAGVSLSKSLETTATVTSADIPGMLETALEYVVANQTGRTDIWICSDIRENDWNANDGRWSSVREKFQPLEGVKFFLLSDAARASDNVTVRVQNVQQRGAQGNRELQFDVLFRREGDGLPPQTIPCELVINGARSALNVELSGDSYLLQGHRVPIDDEQDGGWGRIEIAADENLIDNTSYFVFADPTVHRTVIVYEDAQVADALRITATAPLAPGITYEAELITADLSGQIDLSTASLLIWQTELPEGVLADQIGGFVKSGRPTMFFPPVRGGDREMFGVRWGDWHEREGAEPYRVTTWRRESDLLADSSSGEPLGLGDLKTDAYRELVSESGRSLARLDEGVPLLLRATNSEGPAYYWATLPVLGKSSLAQDGVALYISTQRALSIGAEAQSLSREIDAGAAEAKDVENWRPLDERLNDVLLSQRWINAGAYAEGERQVALARPEVEDLANVLDADQVNGLFEGLDFRRVEQQTGGSGALTSEVWRAVLAVMVLAMLVEAALCLPERKESVPA